MTNLPRNLLFCGLLAGIIAAAAERPSATTVQGVLIDKQCSYKAETRIVPGPRLEGGIVAVYSHTRDCALMPECQKSGYGVFPYETNRFLAFDDAGNRKALAIFKDSGKQDDFRVEVTGVIQGDIMKVASIKLLM